jgi:HSP20 family protein
MAQKISERTSAPAPERWEPLQDLDAVVERMRRMLDQTFSSRWPSLPFPQGAWVPLVDLEETDDAYVLEAELPGVEREDVDVELVGNELTIAGELKEREHTGAIRKRTRRTGRFEYRVGLPEPVDVDKVEASLKGGVLNVRVPKAERAQRRRIELES